MNANEDFFESLSHLGGTQMQQPQSQKLNARSFLDQVKSKLAENQPDAYHHFLYIMRLSELKRIDMPGAIQLVSDLFQDHPELIVGFNAFLPPGYKIEVQQNEQLQIKIPSTNLDGGATSTPTSSVKLTDKPLIIYCHKRPQSSHSMSPHSSPENAVNKVCGSENYELENDFQALTLKNFANNVESADLSS